MRSLFIKWPSFEVWFTHQNINIIEIWGDLLIKRRCNVYLVPNETAKILSTNQKFTIKFFISTILRKYTFSLFFVSNLFKYNRSNIIHCTYFIILILNLVTRKIKRITTTYIIYIYHIQRNYWSQKTFLNEKSLLNSPLKKPPKFPKLWNPSNFLPTSKPTELTSPFPQTRPSPIIIP